MRAWIDRGAVLLAAVGLVALGGCYQAPEERPVSSSRQALGSSPGYVAFAYHSMWVRENSTVTGKVGVRDQSSGPYIGDNAEVTVGLSASLSGGVAGDTIRIKAGAQIDGAVIGNELIQGDNVTLSEPFQSPLALPLSDFTPAMPTIQPGTTAVTVNGQTTMQLAAGAYAAVKLKQGTQGTPTVLRLTGGTYSLQTLEVALNSRVECAAACEIRIKDKLLGEQYTYLGPAAGRG